LIGRGVFEEVGLRLLFRALQFFELLFARKRRAHLRGKPLAFEPIAIARGGFGYIFRFGGVKERIGRLLRSRLARKERVLLGR